MIEVAGRDASGLLVVVRECGYAPAYPRFCGLAALGELAEISTGVDDLFPPIFEGDACQELQPHQEAAAVAADSCRGLA